VDGAGSITTQPLDTHSAVHQAIQIKAHDLENNPWQPVALPISPDLDPGTEPLENLPIQPRRASTAVSTGGSYGLKKEL